MIVPEYEIELELEDEEIDLDIEDNDIDIEVDPSLQLIIKHTDADPYEGVYEVTPRLAKQVLATEDKLMRADVTVHEIPVVSTTNPYGGQTVVIG